MRYCSTRGEEQRRSFEETVFNNFATDNGLYVPETVPNIDLKTLQLWRKFSYVQLCQEICRLFISEDEIPTVELNG